MKTKQEDPTPGQIEVLSYILSYLEQHGAQPSYAEIARELNISVGGVSNRLRGLEEKGLVRVNPRRNRAVELPGFQFRVSVQVETSTAAREEDTRLAG
jgi:DNA-binding Lrp family transcriptional regulator